MALVRLNQPRNVISNNLFSDFDRLFNELATPNRSTTEALNYPADLYETDEQLVLEMAVPGLEAQNLDISVEDRKLVIKASFNKEGISTNDSEGQNKDRRYWMQSISRKDFSRSLKLPNSVDVDAINANVENGLLTLSMPKVAEAKVKKIEIASS